jgi:hypothetical protein
MFAQEGIDVLDLGAEIHCTLILSKLWNEQGNHDLRGLGIRYLDRDPGHKDEIKDWVKANNSRRLVREREGVKVGFVDAPREMVKERAVWDVETTIMLFALFYRQVMDACPELYQN